jgi:endonuclease YncB( thermonuclease family)
MDNLLRNAVILDTETTGLHRGAGLREATVFDTDTRKATEYLLDPNRVRVTPSTPQDVVKFVSSSKDVHSRIDADTWQKIIVQELFDEMGVKTNEMAFMEEIKVRNSMLYKAITSGNFPQMGTVPGLDAERMERLRKAGVSVETRSTSVQKMLAELPDQLRGKTVWIANAVFESKQIGAQLAADNNLDFKKALNLETYSVNNPDPFYVTGVEVNRARVAAQLTGDWRGVFRAYAQHTPAPGQTAVRDIQDVTRAVMSYGRSMGFMKGGTSYFGTSIDVSHKLMALAAGDTKRAMWAEAHRATEDAAIHEDFVRTKGIELASAAEAVEKNTPTGQLYKDMAARGEGPIAELAKLGSLYEQAGPALNRKNLLLRLQRAQEDLVKTGETHQTIGPSGFYKMTQMTPEGYEVNVLRADHATQRFTSMNDLVEHLMKKGEYSDFGINVRNEAEAYRNAATTVKEGSAYVDREIAVAMESLDVSRLRPSAMSARGVSKANVAVEALLEGTKHIGMKGALGGAAVLTGLGAAWSLVQEKPKDQSSLLGYNYYDWLKAQEGMVTSGLAAENRSKNTDFGSPYRGPVVSNEVFNDQKMLAEREKWLRSKYGASHYDPMTGVFGAMGAFRFKSGYNFIHKGEAVENGYQGMTGKNLVKLNLDQGWKVSVEDADTITVRRGGVRGAVQSFFGLNSGYSFRLAGIDAPEVAHGDRSAQPHAEAAKAALEAMMAAGKTSEVVYDPSNVSYGRFMAGLVVDGTNLNYEMVKRGMVGHLPYGKQQNAIVNYASMARAEKQAFGAGRGMWATPWGQAIHTMTEGGQRPTFNTLADVAKVVPNSRYMSLTAIANQAQENGSFDPYVQSAANVGRIMGGADKVGPTVFDAPVSNTELHMTEVMADTAMFMKTHGGGTQNKFSRRSGYGRLDQSMALDTMGTTNSVWTRRRYGAFDTYQTSETLREGRTQYMADRQRAINNQMFQSPIGHHRM